MLTGKELGKAIEKAIAMKIDSGAIRSKADVARHFRVKPPSIHDWINRGSISKEKLPELWRYFSDVVGPEHWGMKAGQAQGHASASNLLPGPPLRSRVPVISWASAGQWEEIVDNNQPGQADEWIDTDAPIRKHTFALQVKGDSMEPDFPNGSCIIVEPESQAENGDFVVVRQNGSEATFKQLVKDGSRVYLKPINPRYPILEMAADAEICGVVVEVVNRRRLK